MRVPDSWVLALVREREGYQRDPRKRHRVIEVDDALGKQGFGVDSSGALVELPKDRAVAKRPAPGQRERAVVKAPETAVPED